MFDKIMKGSKFTKQELLGLKKLADNAKEHGMIEEIIYSMAEYYKYYPNEPIDNLVFFVECEWDL